MHFFFNSLPHTFSKVIHNQGREMKHKVNFELQAAQEKEKHKVEGIFSKQPPNLFHMIHFVENYIFLNITNLN